VKQNAYALQYADPGLRADRNFTDREIPLVAARKTWQELQCMSDAAGTTQAVSQKAPSAESKGCILMEAGGFFAQIPQWEFESEDPNFGALGLQAIELIMQSDAVRALFRGAFEASRASHPFKFKLVKDLQFCGLWSPSERTIHLRDNLLMDPAHFISALIFELTNATRSACFQEAFERACLRDILKEDFAKRYEEIEYENAKTHLDVCKNALCELKWPCAFVEQIEKKYPQTKQDFPTFWGNWKHGAHTEFYRQNYDRVTLELTEHAKAIRSSRQQFADRFLSGTFDGWEKCFIPDDYHTEVLQKSYDSQYPAASACSSAAVPSFEEFARSKRQEALPALISRLRKWQW